MEVLAISITINGSPCSFLGVYNPGSQLLPRDELVHYYNQLPASSKFLFGDFNARHKSWNAGPSNVAGTTLFAFTEATSDLCLLSPPFMGTCFDTNSGKLSSLDLLFGNPSYIDKITLSLCGDLGSDHYPVMVACKHNVARCPSGSRGRWKLSSDTDYFIYSASLEPISYSPDDSIVRNLQTLINNINSAASNCFSFTKGTTVLKSTPKPWWTSACSYALARRHRLKSKLQEHHSLSLYVEYKKATAICKHTINNAKKSSWALYTGQINLHTTLSEAWKIFNRIRGVPPHSTFPLVQNGLPLLTASSKADCLGCHFEAIFNTPASSLNADNKREFTARSIALSHISLDKPFSMLELQAVLQQLPMGKASGNDAIPYEFLKHFPLAYQSYLLQLYNLSWSSMSLPNSWKESVLLPFLKPLRDGSLPSSYRPISLISTV